MILDSYNEFADAVAVNTGGAGTYLVGDVIDIAPSYLAPTTRDLGAGEAPWLVLQVDTQVTSATASPNGAKLQFHLASDAQAAIATDGSATYHYSSPVFEKAALAPGKVIACVKLPSGDYERYLGILQTTSVEAAGGGKINAFLVSDPTTWKAMADAL